VNKFIIILFTIFFFLNPILAENKISSADDFFYIGQM